MTFRLSDLAQAATAVVSGCGLTGPTPGEDNGEAKASVDGTVYTLRGTAVGADRANPTESRLMPFEIKAPC